MMRQESVCLLPVHLSAIGARGESAEKGSAVCAVVALPSSPPKYSIVCYNAAQVTFCVARLNWRDDIAESTNARLMVDGDDIVTFSDDIDQRWRVRFTDAEACGIFLASFGAALLALTDRKSWHIIAHDVSLPSPSTAPRLRPSSHGHFYFRGYELIERDGLCLVGKLLPEVSVVAPAAAYAFHPSSSSYASLSSDAYGFEGNVCGMSENDRRVVVVPAGLPRAQSSSLTSLSSTGVIYVLQLVRLECEKAATTDLAAVASCTNQADAPVPPVYASAAVEPMGDDVGGRGGGTAAAVPLSSSMVVRNTTVEVAGAPSMQRGEPSWNLHGSMDDMTMLRKVEMGLSTASASARDVRDVAAMLAEDWRRATQRPTPSLLSNAALLEAVQRVVNDDEAAQHLIDDLDRQVQRLEGRNGELQQRITTAAADAQRSLEEKSKMSSTIMEERLERDRRLVRLREQLNLKQQEYDDLQRQVRTLKRAVEASDEELRQQQGKTDVHTVQSNNMTNRIQVAQTSLAEARQQNAHLATKIANTQEELKRTRIAAQVAASRLTAAQGATERDRIRYVEAMERERAQWSSDAMSLRHDIVAQLDAGEKRFRAEKQRYVEEQYYRGVADGRAEGNAMAETDLQTDRDGLRLTLTCAKEDVETLKEQVRRSLETSMGLRRTTSSRLAELEEQNAAARQERSALTLKAERWRTRDRKVLDSTIHLLLALVDALAHPTTHDQLFAAMDATWMAQMANSEADRDDEGFLPVDIDNQGALWQKAKATAVAQRVEWIAYDMADLYAKGSAYHYEKLWLQPLVGAHAVLKQDVRQLWRRRYGSDSAFLLFSEEAMSRLLVESEWLALVADIEEWRREQTSARKRLVLTASAGKQDIFDHYYGDAKEIWRWCAAQLRDQLDLIRLEMEQREELLAEEISAVLRLPAQAAQLLEEQLGLHRIAMVEAEESARAAVEAEEYTLFSAARFDAEHSKQVMEEVHRCYAEREAMLAQETAARRSLQTSENIEMDHLKKDESDQLSSLLAIRDRALAAEDLLATPPPVSPLQQLELVQNAELSPPSAAVDNAPPPQPSLPPPLPPPSLFLDDVAPPLKNTGCSDPPSLMSTNALALSTPRVHRLPSAQEPMESATADYLWSEPPPLPSPSSSSSSSEEVGQPPTSRRRNNSPPPGLSSAAPNPATTVAPRTSLRSLSSSAVDESVEPRVKTEEDEGKEEEAHVLRPTPRTTPPRQKPQGGSAIKAVRRPKLFESSSSDSEAGNDHTQ